MIADIAAKKSRAVTVGAASQPITEQFRKVIEEENLNSARGAAISRDEPVFDTPAHRRTTAG